jgi:hypothetical protein
MRYQLHTVQGLLLLVAVAISEVSVFGAQQAFRDELGRLIYTLDDDGAVTMYEKGPTDQTISMSTGTREQMQPQVTGVSPDKVTSGTFTILKISGKNLVGAKAKFSVPDIEVNPYSAKSDSLDLPIRIPATVPASEVMIELTTPIGTTTTSFKISDLQFGGFGSTRREKQTFTTSAPSSCPEGMIGVAYELGGFCIEMDRSFTGDYRKAERACGVEGRRLCQASEWQLACEKGMAGKLPLKNMTGQGEWTGSWESTDTPVGESFLHSVILGRDDCSTKLTIPSGKPGSFAGRCCK